MNKISLLIISATLSLIVVWLSITITMTNVFGNNKPFVNSYDKAPLMSINPRVRCIGNEDTKYKLYNTLRSLKECEGIVSESKNAKMVLQSDGRLIIYDKSKGIIKSSVSFIGDNPFSLENDTIFDKNRYKKDTFLKDVFLTNTIKSRPIKLNDDYTFTVSYDKLPIDFKGQGDKTPNVAFVKIVNKGSIIGLGYNIIDTNDIFKQMLVSLDPLEVMKYCMTSCLNILNILFKGNFYMFIQDNKNKFEDGYFDTLDNGFNFNPAHLQEILNNMGSIDNVRFYFLKYAISSCVLYCLNGKKIPRDYSYMIAYYVCLRLGICVNIETEYDTYGGYFLLNTELKYPGFVERTINGFSSSSDINEISKSITSYTLDELFNQYKNNLELYPTVVPKYLYVPDPFIKE